MKTASIYRCYRFPTDVIAHAVWLHQRFTLSLRDVEDLLAERGVVVSYGHARERERQMRGFRSDGHAQRFLSVHGQCHNLFRVGRHLLSAHNPLPGRGNRVGEETDSSKALAATHDAGVTLSSKEQHASPRFKGAIVRHCGLYKSMA
jgi:hypothetical protein